MNNAVHVLCAVVFSQAVLYAHNKPYYMHCVSKFGKRVGR